MKQDTIEIRVLTASEGMILTNGETYSSQVFLGIHDGPENWWEIPEEDYSPTSELLGEEQQ